jgi:hypothetical protein
MIVNECGVVLAGRNPNDILQNKVRHLRHFVRGGLVIRVVFKKQKEHLISSKDNLDINPETCHFNISERDALRKVNDRFCKPRRDEEAKWV